MLAVVYVLRLMALVLLTAAAPLALAAHALPQTAWAARWWWRALTVCLAIQAAQANPPVRTRAHDRPSSAKTPASTHWDFGALPPPTSTPSGSDVARVTPIRPALQPAAIMVFMALYSGASAPLNRPVPRGVELAFAAPVVSAGLRR